ncbi:hypothetical protein ACFL6C_08720 [Myxococcota bacterium]
MHDAIRIHALIIAVGCLTISCAGEIGFMGEQCGDGGPCKAGSVCLEGVCAQLCTSDTHCQASGTICGNDVCVEGERTDAPVVMAVNGDSATDPTPGHTDNHVHRRVTILGENLSGVAVHLLNEAGDDYELTVCSAGDQKIEVELPDSISAGEHVLSVATSAGICDAVLPVLQGEPGAEGPKGDIGKDGVTGATGGQGPKGDTGDRGSAGATGAQGPKGDTGDRGSAGATGAPGPAGPAGAIGATGAQGPTGPQGASGIGWGGQTCVFQQTCEAGLNYRGLSSFLLHVNYTCPYDSNQIPYNGSWNWCNTRLCCNW